MTGRKRVLTDLKISRVAAVDLPCQEPATSTILKRAFTEDERKAMAEKGEALPDGSYPIATKGDLKNAIQAFGRAGNSAKVKAHIKTRAKALDAEDMLPEEWNPDATNDVIAKARSELAKIVDQPAAQGFAEILAANEAREQCWAAETAMWPLFDALRGSLSSIAADQTMGDPAKLAAAQVSVSQFVGALQQEWPAVAEEVAEIAKASSNSAAMELFIKAGTPGISKEASMADKTPAELQKAVDDLTAENTTLKAANAEFVQAAEKAKANPFAEMEDDKEKPTKKGLDFLAKHAPKGVDEVLKVGDQTISKSAVGDQTFAMFKAQAEEIAKARDERETAVLEKRVESEFPSLVGTTAEKAKVLKAIAGAPEDVRKSAEAIFVAAEKAVKGAFETKGHSGGTGSPLAGGGTLNKARDDFMAKVNEIKSRDKITKTAAMSKAQTEFPELFKAYRDADAPEAE